MPTHTLCSPLTPFPSFFQPSVWSSTQTRRTASYKENTRLFSVKKVCFYFLLPLLIFLFLFETVEGVGLPCHAKGEELFSIPFLLLFLFQCLYTLYRRTPSIFCIKIYSLQRAAVFLSSLCIFLHLWTQTAFYTYLLFCYPRMKNWKRKILS